MLARRLPALAFAALSFVALVGTIGLPQGLFAGEAQASTGPCALAQVAFCDTFDQPYGGTPFGNGGRSGALDPSRWSVTRLSQNTNPSQGIFNEFQPTNAMFCKQQISGLLPDSDFFMCNGNGTESMHYMEAVNDEGLYVMNSARIRQPFDFANRTGTIAFDVDAKTAGEHTWWVEVWITPEPIPAVHHASAVGELLPQNGLGILFSNPRQWPGTYMQPEYAMVLTNGHNNAMTDYNGLNQIWGVSTMDDMRNHFEIRVSQQRLELWGSESDGSNFHMMSYVDPLNLPFSRGYVSLQHSQYNAAKEGVTKMQTYHWDNVGFDGPVLPMQRGYDVPDSLTQVNNGSDPPGSINLGYSLGTNAPKAFTLNNVDLTNATQAWLDFDIWWETLPTFQYRLNGKTWRTAALDTGNGYMWHGSAIQVPVTDLVQGTNTLEMMTSNHTAVSNIDLSIDPSSASPAVSPPTPTPTATPSAKPTPATPTPTATPVPSPTSSKQLAGDNVIETTIDTDSAGTAEAFKYTAGASGSATKLNVYLDSTNTAGQVVVGLYSHNGATNAPANLLAQGTIAAPVRGAWNTVTIPTTALSAGSTYWIAVLAPAGTSGTLAYRDRANGSASQSSAQTTLTTLPSVWMSGQNWPSSPMSAWAGS